MASENRNKAVDVSLYDEIRATPYRFGFQLTLRRLDCIHHDRPPTGLSKRACDEPLRLGQTPGLDFAPANLQACELTPDGERYVLRSRFLGMFGPNAPLPLHLTEYARDRMRRHHDDTFSQFMDLFHHRLLSLFYRAWATGQPTVHMDRADTDRFSAYVGSMIGHGTDSFRNRDAVSDHAKLSFAGRIASQPRNAEGLQAMLAAFFHMPCEIQQFSGHWMSLPADCRTHLGGFAESTTLGQSALCGDRIWDTQSKFRVVFGPVELDQFCRLLPGQAGLKRLIALVRNYVGDELLWDIQLKLKRESIPQIQLGQQGQLGWTSFLTSGAADADSVAAVFTPND
ncbi:hypothetical protein Pla52o_29660 [Novipirellula galeiformis]|uniref:Type VI secretion protein n=1 Tax=Novipirellula galeiformis TaxID=2528004 RepID=A0A5C6CFM7_9BACT|nr:type VI secretion system baseplate subunit TssG [Novipirellula galeiformis]TWU23430.1 hypothetical protein Pla52o_29660 [Novipirellula galeiformis]